MVKMEIADTALEAMSKVACVLVCLLFIAKINVANPARRARLPYVEVARTQGGYAEKELCLSIKWVVEGKDSLPSDHTQERLE